MSLSLSFWAQFSLMVIKSCHQIFFFLFVISNSGNIDPINTIVNGNKFGRVVHWTWFIPNVVKSQNELSPVGQLVSTHNFWEGGFEFCILGLAVQPIWAQTNLPFIKYSIKGKIFISILFLFFFFLRTK